MKEVFFHLKKPSGAAAGSVLGPHSRGWGGDDRPTDGIQLDAGPRGVELSALIGTRVSPGVLLTVPFDLVPAVTAALRKLSDIDPSNHETIWAMETPGAFLEVKGGQGLLKWRGGAGDASQPYIELPLEKRVLEEVAKALKACLVGASD